MGRVWIWVRNAMLLAVLGAFAFFFGQPKGSDRASHGRNVVLSVNGEEVPRDVFEWFRELNEQTFKQYSQQGVDTEQLSKMIDDQTLQSLLRRYLMSQEAESLGLSVSDASVKDNFQREFTKDGVYDRGCAERALTRSGLGVREYASQVRRDLLMRNFSRFVASPVRISDGDVRDEILRNDTKVTLRVATASKAALREHITVTPEEAKALVEKEPERVKGAYQMHISDYTKEEQIHARHMLFTGDDAEAEALKARARLDAGEKFADVAKQVSADQATRDEGGDLGSFPRGRMMP